MIIRIMGTTLALATTNWAAVQPLFLSLEGHHHHRLHRCNPPPPPPPPPLPPHPPHHNNIVTARTSRSS